MKFILLLCLLIVAMGQLGKEGISEITGLNITSGFYEMKDCNNAVIHAEGIKNGVVWQVICDWKNGRPTDIMIFSPVLKQGDI